MASENPDSQTRGKTPFHLLTGHALSQRNQSQDNHGNTNLLKALTYNFKLTLRSDPKTSITFIKNQKT